MAPMADRSEVTTMLEIENLRKVYAGRGGRAPLTVLDGVNLKVRAGEFVSVIGPSGCGKTTLLKLLDGLIQPDGGEIRVRGQKVTGPGPDRAVVFQNFALLPWNTVLQNVAFPLELRGVPRREREELAAAKLEMVGLKDFAHHYPHELSGGMQQRVGIARALVANPDILLMDEPFGALDPQTRLLLQDELLSVWQRDRKTVLFVTHAMDEAVYLSDRVVILAPRPGRVAEVLEIPLPRPRGEEVRATAAFADLTQYVWHRIKGLMQPAEGESHGGAAVGS